MHCLSFKKHLFIVFVIIAILQVSYTFFMSNNLDEIVTNSTRDLHFSQHKKKRSFKYNPVFYIPHSTVSFWNERDFLIALGIPSLDIEKRRWRRQMQRSTCWQFPGVATKHNNYTGAMLVLYVLGRHPLNNFVLSDAVVQEAKQWHDVLIHPINEGLSDTNKLKVGEGYWGFEAEIGASRKTFIWFQMALLMFPRVPYLAKGDDDIFLRVPQYLADLRRLPIKRTYWGRQSWKKVLFNKNGVHKIPFRFMIGPCYTMSRDIAEHITSHEPLRKMIWVPFRKERLLEFRLMSIENEDVMVGRLLEITGYPTIRVREPSNRFHLGALSPVTDAVMVKHTPKEQDYYTFMTYFNVNGTTTPDTVIFKKSSMDFKMQPPEQQKTIVKKDS